MARNVWSVGSQTLNGSFGRILSAGELDINNVKAEKLYAAGEMMIKDSSIKKVRVAGEINGENVNFKNLKVAGEVNLKGHCKADSLVIVGEMNVDILECNILRNGSKRKLVSRSSDEIICFSGLYKGETFENLYPFSLNCDFEFSNIISKEKLVYPDILECERFYSFSELEIEGVNADFIYIKPSENSKVEKIMGSKIIISENWKGDKDFKKVPKTMSPSFYLKGQKGRKSRMTVSRIEGDNIYIDNLKADLVSGMEIIVGDNCEIEKLEYQSSIKISKRSNVNEVIKDE